MAENENVDIAAALTKKLSEKPDTLERLFNIIDRLDTLDEFTAILKAQKDSATDELVQRVAGNITTGLTLVDSLSGEEQLSMIKAVGENSASLKSSIEKIADLEKQGTLQALKDMSEFITAFSRGTTDSMVERLTGTAEKLAELTDALSDENMAGLIKKVQYASGSLESSLGKIEDLEKQGTLQALKDMGEFVTAFSRGTTDSMVERLAGTGVKVAELSDMLLQYDLKPLLDAGDSFASTGTLNDLVELSNGLASARRMLTDGLVDRAVGTALELVEALLTQVDIKELIKVADCTAHETLGEIEEEKYHKGGILSLVSLAKDKEVMQGIKFMMLLAKNLTKNLKKNSSDIFISSAFGKED